MSLSQEFIDNLNDTSLYDIIAGLEQELIDNLNESSINDEDDSGYLELSNFEDDTL